MRNILDDLDNRKNKNRGMLLKIVVFIKNINKKSESENKIRESIQLHHSKNKKQINIIPVEMLFLEHIKKISKGIPFDIPSFPAIITELNKAVSEPNSNFLVFSNIIKKDSSITLKILKLANSPVYKRSVNILNLEDAVGVIGLESTKNLILSVITRGHLFRPGFSKKIAKDLWKDAILTAIIAENIAKFLKLNESFLYTLALLHNIGATIALDQAIIFQNKTNIILSKNELVNRIIKKFEHELTKIVLEEWKFNDLFIDAVLSQDEEKKDGDNLLSKIMYFSQTVSKSMLSGDLKILGKEGLPIFYQELISQAKLNIPNRTIKMLINQSLIEFDVISKLVN